MTTSSYKYYRQADLLVRKVGCACNRWYYCRHRSKYVQPRRAMAPFEVKEGKFTNINQAAEETRSA